MNELTKDITIQICEQLKNNKLNFYQFYNVDITSEENSLIQFKQKFKENKEPKILNKTYYDIEVINNLNEFPDPKKLKFPINSIATYNNILNETVIFVVMESSNIMDVSELEELIKKEYNELIKTNNVYEVLHMKIKVLNFSTEADMLEAFFSYMKDCRTLQLTGFNSSTFDDPYTFGRMYKLFDQNVANDIITDFGEVRNYSGSYSIIDYTNVDLLYLYKPIDAQGAGYGKSLPDYKLNTIAKKELKITKLELEGNFWDSFHNNIVNFLTYNMLDTILTFKLDDKLKFTELIFELGKHNESTFSKSVMGRSLMFKDRNNHLYTTKGKLIRTRKFSDEINYPIYKGSV